MNNLSTVAPTRLKASDTTSARADLDALKTRQHGAWSSGDYAHIGTTLQIVGEQLCESMDLRAGCKLLDVAAGNGNVSLAAARRWCDVTSTDYVPALLERAVERAVAERLLLTGLEADAEALPFRDDTFDAVVSTFGVMFTPDRVKRRWWRPVSTSRWSWCGAKRATAIGNPAAQRRFSRQPNRAPAGSG